MGRIGSPTYVDSENRAALYASSTVTTIRTTKSKNIFRLGSCLHPTCSIISTQIPISKPKLADINVNVIEIDVPFLLGLELLTMVKIVIDFENDVMRSNIDGTTVPITR